MVTRTFVPNDAQKHSGIVLREASQLGYTISFPSVDRIQPLNSMHDIVAEDASKRTWELSRSFLVLQQIPGN